MMETSSALYFC